MNISMKQYFYLFNKFRGEEIVGQFFKKELQKTNKKNLGIEKVIKKKGKNYMSN